MEIAKKLKVLLVNVLFCKTACRESWKGRKMYFGSQFLPVVGWLCCCEFLLRQSIEMAGRRAGTNLPT